MQRGDMVKLKDSVGTTHARDGYVIMYTDEQMLKIVGTVYLENYTLSPSSNPQAMIAYEDVAVVLDMKNVYKDGDGIDVVWNRFVKVLTSRGKLGWIAKSRVERIPI